MKRTIIAILACILLCLPCYSIDSSDWKVDTILAGFGNDNITYGIARNNDDGLSFGALIQVGAPIWWAQFDIKGYTNRGWKTDWNDPASFYIGRYDVIQMGYGMKWTPLQEVLPPWLTLQFTPYLGLHLAGNLGLDAIQNLYHSIIDKPYVGIPYDPQIHSIHVAPAFDIGMSVSASRRITWSDTGVLNIAIKAQSKNAMFFETSQQLSLSLNLLSHTTPIVSIWGGWKWIQAYTDWPTQRLFAAQMTGPVIGFDVTAGLVSINFAANPKERIGYGIISANLGIFLQQPTWKTSDVFLTMGMAYSMGRSLHIFKFNTILPPFPSFSITTTIHYKGGALDNKSEQDNPQLPRLRSNNSDWIISGCWEMQNGFFKDWVAPYVSVGLGIHTWDIIRHTNHIPDAQSPITVLFDGIRPLIDLEVGLHIIPQGLLRAGNATYQLEVGAGITHVFGTREIRNQLQDAGQLVLNLVQPWVYRVFVSLRYGIDL